jgi:hypothetical protein
VQCTLDQVAHLRATVRECLAALDAAAPDDPEVGRAFEALAAGFEALGDPSRLLADALPADRARLELELSQLTRIHAVLIATAARDRDRLCALLERARSSMGAVRGAAQAGRTGDSCDLSA